MKPTLLPWAILFFISIPFFSSAQSGFHIGIGGGFNSTWIVSQNNFETLSDCTDPLIQSSELAYELTFGYTAGGSMGYNFDDHHGFQLGMQYSKTGQEYQDGFTSSFCPAFSDVRRKIDLTYFQIPIQYKISGQAGRRIIPYGLLGMQFGFLITSEEEVMISGVLKENFQVSAEDKFRDFDFGLALEGGVDFYLKDYVFVNAGLSTYVGLTDINGVEVNTFVSKNDADYKASRNYKIGLQVGLHYLFQNYRRRAAW